MSTDERRFTELLSLALGESMAEAEQEEFERLQCANPQWVIRHLDTVFTHSLLQWQSEDISDCLSLELAACASEKSLRESVAKTRSKSWLRLFTLATAIASLAGGLWLWQSLSASESVAEILTDHDVAWTNTSTALGGGKTIVPGRLENTAGSFTLQFRSGSTVRIAGPASLDIRSAMLVYLNRGQATARVSESGKGFAIETPVAKLVDQGTEFGVIARDDGKTDVVVFEGRVDLHGTAQAPAKFRNLTIGDGARIGIQGSVDRIMEVGRDTAGGWWTNNPSSDEHLIAGVRDNIVSDVSDMFTCYQTTYGGLKEDALAYADNPDHQWNGLTSDGLPDFLRGADYIKTFNDYRYRQDYELTVEIARPANLYVFSDNRIPPPEWLKEQFQDTGVDIGLDEGRWLHQAPEKYRELDKNMTDVGGGNSIDNKFSVWRRRCLLPGRVTLGEAGKWATEGKQGRAMYGVAATPLDESSLSVRPAGT